ncbi:MAG: GNAT family N-acetyltransferase [Gammaproteobacteria bacterium]|nr:GNAT family N-acetyltransferase [Gammaproteobacteria bacterium]
MLETKRLLLRVLDANDAAKVQMLANQQSIADQTIMIPYPYPDGLASQWIAHLATMQVEGKQAVFAITIKATGELIGVVGLVIKDNGSVPELGYWLGVDYWGQGYMSEAVMAIIDYGFSELKLSKISALHFMQNAASGRVLEKCGFHFVRNSTCFVRKWDKEVAIKYYEIIK